MTKRLQRLEHLMLWLKWLSDHLLVNTWPLSNSNFETFFSLYCDDYGEYDDERAYRAVTELRKQHLARVSLPNELTTHYMKIVVGVVREDIAHLKSSA